MSETDKGAAIVTGAGRGIGAAIAVRLAEDGYPVVVADLRSTSANEATRTVKDTGGIAEAYSIDVRDSEAVAEMVEFARSRFGNVSILVNNAAIIRNNMLVRMTDEDWDTVIETNLRSVFLLTRAVGQLMIEDGGGTIVNIASGSAAGMVGQANYSSSKAALHGFTKTAALELAPHGIRVNAVAPGFIETPMTEVLAQRAHQELPRFIEDAKSRIPLGRTGRPEDIAGAVSFLCSPDASFITGQILNVRGGPGPAS